MTDLTIRAINDVHIQVVCEPGLAHELSEFFTFAVPGAQFMPSFKSKYWDGKMRLFNINTGILYRGLISHILQFAKERDYSVAVSNDIELTTQVSENEFVEFVKSLKLPHKPRDYQLKALLHAIRTRRHVFLSPTSSGKSLMIYMMAMWRLIPEDQKHVVIIVPSIGLVTQMRQDFIDYGCDPDIIQIIKGGESKIVDCPIVITTWQSIVDLPPKWFEKFTTVFGDEAHTWKAKSLTKIMEKLRVCPMKIGCTGTLDGSQVNKLVLEGLFGPVIRIENTANLMKNKQVAQLSVQCIVLKYPDEEKKLVSKMAYADEIDYLVTHPRRLDFVARLAVSRKGNTLVLFQYVAKHGKPLFERIKELSHDQRKVFFVSGGTDSDQREYVRRIVETEDDAIIVASYGVFSTGISIKRLHNAIAASPTKSIIRLLQSIGRILRIGTEKDCATWYDIADDFSWKAKINYTLKHFGERFRIYNAENFEHKVTTKEI
jgi:superfamily II DNA or RNA helicase